MDKILIPPHPGIFSAYGLAIADVRIDYVRADGAVPSDTLSKPALQERVDGLRAQAMAEFTGLGYPADGLELRYFVDARYVGQGYELRVPFDPPISRATALKRRWIIFTTSTPINTTTVFPVNGSKRFRSA